MKLFLPALRTRGCAILAETVGPCLAGFSGIGPPFRPIGPWGKSTPRACLILLGEPLGLAYRRHTWDGFGNTGGAFGPMAARSLRGSTSTLAVPRGLFTHWISMRHIGPGYPQGRCAGKALAFGVVNFPVLIHALRSRAWVPTDLRQILDGHLASPWGAKGNPSLAMRGLGFGPYWRSKPFLLGQHPCGRFKTSLWGVKGIKVSLPLRPRGCTKGAINWPGSTNTPYVPSPSGGSARDRVPAFRVCTLQRWEQPLSGLLPLGEQFHPYSLISLFGGQICVTAFGVNAGPLSAFVYGPWDWLPCRFPC